MNKKLGMIVAIGAAVILIGAVGISMANNYSGSSTGWYSEESKANGDSDGDCDGETKMRMLNRFNLTEEQRKEIIDKMKSVREDGADRDEIRDTVIDMVEDYGAELPGPMGEGRKDMHRQRRGKCSGENY